MTPTTVDCPFCVEGSSHLNPNTGNPEPCSVCLGTGMLTPDDICACGAPCNTISEGIPYCGDDKCLAKSQEQISFDPFEGESF